MTLLIKETTTNTVSVEERQFVVVEQEQVRVLTVGVQGPPGAQGPVGEFAFPEGGEGGILFNQGSKATLDADNLRYDAGSQQLVVSRIANAMLDGGNF
jgi:hypothetical protein